MLRGYPDRSEVLAQVEPVYATLPGWKTSLRGASAFSDLPPNARQLVELVEKNVGVPVTMVGTGPERDDCVVRG
jgi:adenylosuccinate synthase